MCRVTELLERSAVFGPVVRLACRSVDSLQVGVINSLAAKVAGIVSVNNVMTPFAPLLKVLVLVALAGLLLSFNVFDTGPIGALTWGLLLLSLLLAGSRRDIEWHKQFTVIDVMVVLFIASACVSASFSSYLKYSVIGVAKMSTFVAGYAGFRIISVVFGQYRLFWNVLALAVAGIGLFQSGVGFYQFTHHVDARATWVDPTINPELNMTRVFGTLKPANPNLLAGFLVPGLSAAIGIIVWQIAGLVEVLPSGNRKLFLPKFAMVAASVLAAFVIIGALVLTGSRGGFLALIGIGLTLFAFFGHLLWNPSEVNLASSKIKTGLFSYKSLKALWLAVLAFSVLGMVTVIAVSPQLRYRVASIFAMRNDSSISYRLNVYNSVTRMIKDNPVIGIGPGNDTFKRVYGYYMVPGFNALGAYSVPLEITAEQGFVGLGIFVLMLMLLKLRALYFMELDRPLSEKMTAIVLYSGIVGSILYGIFDTIWYRPSVNLQFWLFVALLVQLTKPLETSPRFLESHNAGTVS